MPSDPAKPEPIAPAGHSAEAPAGDQQKAQATRDTSRAGGSESLADRPHSPGAPAVPEMFGRYRILQTLGQGAMGAVFLAEDTQLQRRVALKIPKFAEHSREHLLERFYREARSAATLRHAHICPVYDVGEIDGTHYLTMAFIDGKPLSEVIKKSKPLTERQAAGVVRKLALGLFEAHAQGVVHRDLKPANIMIDRKGDPVVTDFGLARQLEQADESRITQTGAILGTPAYMSPEQVEADPAKIGPASDVYALGVILYELLTGQLPFQGPVTSVLAQIVSKTPATPANLREGLDPNLEAICLKMMARQPAERYRSMREVAEALSGWLRGSSLAASAGGESVSRVPAVVTRPASSADTSARESATATRSDRSPSDGDRLESLLLSEADAPVAPVQKRQMRLRGASHPPGRRWLIIGGAAAGLLMVLSVVLLLRTPTGTIRVELGDATAGVEVRVDGSVVSIEGLEEPLRLKVGEHELVVTGPKFETTTRSFTVKNGDNPVLQVTLVEKPPPATSIPGKAIEARAAGDRGDADIGKRSAAEVARADGWIDLFNGKDLAGWVVAKGEVATWMAKDGDLIGASNGRATDQWILTDKDYGNFVLRFDYRLRQGDNASGGITFRTLPTDRRMPLKLMDDESRTDWSVKEGERTGTLWANGKMLPMRDAKVRPGGEWNEAELMLNGRNLTLSINGEQVQSLDLSEFARRAGDFPTLTRTAGRIGLQAHTSIIRFRNIRIKPLPATAATSEPKPATPGAGGEAKTGGAPVDVPPVAAKTPAPRIEVKDDPAWPRNKWIRLEIPDVTKFDWLKNPRYQGGILEFRSEGGGFGFPRVPMSRNMIIRAKVKPLERSGNVGLSLRDGPDGGLYAFYNPSDGLVGFTSVGKPVNITPFKDFFEFELSAIGEKLTIKTNGKVVLEATDTQSSWGWPGLNAWHCRVQFKDLEIKILDEISADEKRILALGSTSGERRGGARILQHKLNDWPNSKTDYARFDDPLIEVGLGSEAPGWGWGATGVEIENVRRIRFALTASGFFKKLGDDAVDCGFKIDYRTPAGYTKRVALSLWNQTPKKYSPVPPWGQGRLPDQVEKIGLRRAYDLDLARWAPPDWDGHVWFNVMTQNTGTGTRLKVHLLELVQRE